MTTRPGIVLADEVGMGKTYEALGDCGGNASCTHPRTRIVIVTPPDPILTGSGREEFPRFKEMFDFGDDIRSLFGQPR